MYLKSETGLNLMVGVRVCEYWRNLKIQGLAESVALFQLIVMFILVVYVNCIFIFLYSPCPEESRSSIAASIIMYTELCAGFSDCNSCVHTSFQCVWCGTAGCSYQRCRENILNNAAAVGREGTEWKKCTLSEHFYSNILFLNYLAQ